MIRELSEQEIERFWKYVDRKNPRECWPWLRTGAGTAPMFAIDNSAVSALRIMYRLYYGEDVPENMAVLRKCGASHFDCINPRHLVVVKRGTRYGSWWKRRIAQARHDIHDLAELAGFELVPTESGRYLVAMCPIPMIL